MGAKKQKTKKTARSPPAHPGHLAQTTLVQNFLLCMKEIVPQNFTFARQKTKNKKNCQVTTGPPWPPGPDDPCAKLLAVHERNSPAKFHICAPKTKNKKNCQVTTGPP